VSEAFVLGEHDFRLPGLGSYMSVAAARGDRSAMLASVVAMTVLIVALDQILWRPLVVWAQRFRSEESGQTEVATSWFYDLLLRSRILAWLTERGRRRAPRRPRAPRPAASRFAVLLPLATFAALLVGLASGGVALFRLVHSLSPSDWASVAASTGLTLVRVLVAVALGTLWTVPAGLAIGLSPRLSRILQPVVQVVASFPAPMLFPAVIVVLRSLGVGLGVGSVVLMLLGTQWYVLFNVIAGASAIPADLREAARLYRLGRWRRFRALYAPAILPFLITGWVTAAGGAWNASIVAEYVSFEGQVLATTGVGATISRAAADARFGVLAAAVTVMSLTVVTFNRLVWRRLGAIAEERFSLQR
jgi:NitT/TauT family transport system permease protein